MIRAPSAPPLSRPFGLVLTIMLGGCGTTPSTTPVEIDEPNSDETSRAATEPEADAPQTPADEAPVAPPAPRIGIDTHVDTTQRMLDDGIDISERLENGHLDLPRMHEGGLTAAFFSIWVNPEKFPGPAAWDRSLALISAVEALAAAHPDQAMLATTVDDVRRAAREGKIALLMGVEGGHALGTRAPEVTLERLRELHRRGVRYMTITWSNDNALGHSSTGGHADRGLTDLGRRVIHEMNALGMIVDVSHVSDRTFWDIMEVAERPVMASHSSARALAEHPRNMDDAMIRRVAETGGAVCVNYFSQFIDVAYRDRRDRLERRYRRQFRALADGDVFYTDRGLAELRLAQELDESIAPPTMETLGAHFAHIVALGGPGAACLGSDFDGIPELPLGMESVADLGALEAELARRELDVTAIFGENVLRVLAAQSAPAPTATP